MTDCFADPRWHTKRSHKGDVKYFFIYVCKKTPRYEVFDSWVVIFYVSLIRVLSFFLDLLTSGQVRFRNEPQVVDHKGEH